MINRSTPTRSSFTLVHGTYFQLCCKRPIMKSLTHWNIKTYCSCCWTIFGLALLISSTMSQGEGSPWSLVVSDIVEDDKISEMMRYVAMKVPVLPTPALQWTNIGELEDEENLKGFYTSFSIQKITFQVSLYWSLPFSFW